MNKIPGYFHHNGEKFNLKFLSLTNGHIICYSVLNRFFWEMNDVGMSEKITFEVFKQFNPDILVPSPNLYLSL